MITKGIFASAVLLLAMTPVCATDLLAVYRQAQASDPIIASARFALDTMREKVPQARADLLPIVALTGSKGNTRAVTEFTDQLPLDRNMDAWSWNLQLTQPLVRYSAVYAYRVATHVVEQAQAQYAQAQQDLVLQVSQAYFGVLIAQDAICAADSQVAALNEQLALVTRGYQQGTHAVTDVDDTKSRLGSARSQRIAAQNDLENARADLEKLTGKAFDQGADALAALQTTVTPPPPTPANNRTWMEQARKNHPLVQAARAALEAAQLEIIKDSAAHMPTLDLVLNLGSNYSSHSLTTPDDFSTRAMQIELALKGTVPVYSGGAMSSKVREAVATMHKAEADLETASRQAATDAQQAYAGVTNGLGQIDAMNTAVASGHSAVKGNRVGYGLGIRINIDVLNAEQQLFAAQRDLSKARYTTLLQGLKLKAAAGILGEDDLVAVNAMLH